jgi:1-acyl-sn-glycerol-3-phosphate acyltransferase
VAHGVPSCKRRADVGSLLPAWRAWLCLALVVPVLGFACVLAMLLVLLHLPRRWVDRVYLGFARFALFVAGTRVEVHGLEHVSRHRAYVIVPNHESGWDPVVLVAALAALPVRFIAKEQAIRVPLLGRTLLLTGNVRVERANTAADVARIREAMARRPPDVSTIFYAEGTRSRDGALHEFKKGAFATAIAQGMSVLPVATAGTRRIWPPDTMRMRRGPVVVEVGAPIAVEGLTLADRDALRERTRAVVGELRESARRRLRALGYEPGGVDGAIPPLHRRETPIEAAASGGAELHLRNHDSRSHRASG